jgi:hypothetical protein
MKRSDVRNFNKEKLIFLIASGVFAAALFLFLAFGPVALQPGKPMGTQTGPLALDESKFTLADSTTQIKPDRQRKNPFAPNREYNEASKNPPANPAGNTMTPAAPPPPPPVEKTPEPAKPAFEAQVVNAEVDFMGVVMLGGETYGLLKPKDGSSPQRVKVGDKLPDLKYTVTKIEKQAIWLTDEEGRPFVVTDGGLGSGEPVSDNTSSHKKSTPAPHHTPDKPAPDKPVPVKKDPPPAQPKAPKHQPKKQKTPKTQGL